MSYITYCTFTHVLSSKLSIMQNRKQVKADLSNKTSEAIEKLAPSLPMLEAYFYVITFVGGVFFSLYCFYLAGQKELERLKLDEVEPWWYVQQNLAPSVDKCIKLNLFRKPWDRSSIFQDNSDYEWRTWKTVYLKG